MHRTTERFRQARQRLPRRIRERADKAFALLRENPRHPSLHFKKVGVFWSARMDAGTRALAVRDGGDFVWVWIGSHDDYERIIGRR